MIEVHFWKPGGQEGSASPFGRLETVADDIVVAERAMRSLATWNALNALSVYVAVGSDPEEAIARTAAGLHPLQRDEDSELVHVIYVANPWRHAHVVFSTADRKTAIGAAKFLSSVGHDVGDCVNDEDEVPEATGAPPFYVWVLTGELSRPAPETPPPPPPAPSLVGLATED
jgi:hypothetical protein